jgi:DNA-binding LytR/AlgR family response regulator
MQITVTNHGARELYSRIVLPSRMPGINGFELARAIWRQDESAQICFLTAFEIYEQEAKAVFKDFKTHCFVKKANFCQNSSPTHSESPFERLRTTY